MSERERRRGGEGRGGEEERRREEGGGRRKEERRRRTQTTPRGPSCAPPSCPAGRNPYYFHCDFGAYDSLEIDFGVS